MEKTVLSNRTAKPYCAKHGFGFWGLQEEALCLMHFTTGFTVLVVNVTDQKSREEMRLQKVPTANSGEAPKESMSGKDTELGAGKCAQELALERQSRMDSQ